jgi:protein-S-isoprenylcysteine O-methyltransferase Ste14
VDAIRYYLALILVVTYPPAFLFWFAVHPFIGFWRRVGTAATYLVTTPAMLGACYALYHFRRPLLAVEYGTNWALAGVGVALYGLAMVVEVKCRRYLSLRTLVGVPELKAPGEGPGKLLREGIYARVRHPRYLGVLLGGVGVACFANYQAGYVLMLGLLPVAYALTVIEETELRQRFGEAYVSYSQDVPRLIPRLRRA